MKIVLANKFYFLKGAGAEQYVFDLEHVLNTHGHTTIPFAMQQRKNHETPFNRFFVSSIETEKAQLGLEGLRGLGRMVYSFESAKKMRALIQETHPDLCHIHNIYYQISPSILSVLHEKGIPMVMTVHDYHLISPQYMMWSRGRVENWRNVPLWRSAIARFHKHSFLASAAAAFTFRLHERMGLDHRDAMDVAVHPDSPEGRALMAYLRGNGIPFIAFWNRVSGAATGAHIHIGRPSLRMTSR